MKMPILLSVPHAGLQVPPEARPYCVLTPDEIRVDGDEGAREIYALEDDVRSFLTTEVARAIIDLNRPEDDRRPDGVIKTETCFQVPVYDPVPSAEVFEALLEAHYRPYHRRLRELARGAVRLGVDGHTMLAEGPPIGPGAGEKRPDICLSNADGTCSDAWLTGLAECLERAFGRSASLNEPFKGGHIIRSHAGELPWVQIEMNRRPFAGLQEKRGFLRQALREFCARFLSTS